jgi:hypothetical protein
MFIGFLKVIRSVIESMAEKVHLFTQKSGVLKRSGSPAAVHCSETPPTGRRSHHHNLAGFSQLGRYRGSDRRIVSLNSERSHNLRPSSHSKKLNVLQVSIASINI